MKALAKLLGQLVVALTLSTTLLHGTEVDNSAQSERSIIGQRSVSDEEREFLYQNDEEEASEETQTQEMWGVNAYYPIDYSKTTIVEVGYLGHTIILQDQSVWTIRPRDGKTVQNWNEQAKEMGQHLNVFFTSNDNWFFDREYLHRMVNMQTGESVYCNLSQSPFLIASTWILNMDVDAGWVELTDSQGNYLVMTLNYSDRAIFADWEREDTVIIGRNLRWGASSSPYLLINIPTMTHARCNK